MTLTTTINCATPSSISRPYSQEIESSTSKELTRKLEPVALRILKSPFFWASVTTGSLATFTAVALTGSAMTPAFCSAALISLIGIGILIRKNQDKIWFELSLLCVRIESFAITKLRHLLPFLEKRNWFDKITLFDKQSSQGNLYLGAIPLASMGHHHEIRALGNNQRNLAVLSVLQPFENQESGAAGDPVYPTDWKELETEHKQVEIFDLHPIEPAQIGDGAAYIHQHLQDKDVYVHCKAGRGRSAMMVIGYLLKHRKAELSTLPGEDLVQKAIHAVRFSRPQIYLSSEQVRALYRFEQSLA
jgi:protein-tyrosine phosphatase